jgi:hypothetical protein
MSLCCPPGLGCNAPRGGEPCVLDLCRELSRREPAALAALDRWRVWQNAVAAGCSGSEARFHRRSYERARDPAMGVLVMALARARRGPARRRLMARGGASPGRARRPRRELAGG